MVDTLRCCEADDNLLGMYWISRMASASPLPQSLNVRAMKIETFGETFARPSREIAA